MGGNRTCAHKCGQILDCGPQALNVKNGIHPIPLIVKSGLQVSEYFVEPCERVGSCDDVVLHHSG
jgi:hypothetical protein